ncbi:40S ribosomal S11 [Cordyceps militaris]|uniref:40S ribosomal S11 n=1 Tax=Cordyceps militaris TaxID=73501 RepID=A0A2H4SM63_CORMI|nr:40S ribosomal S11 [Cordyceps militaris]
MGMNGQPKSYPSKSDVSRQPAFVYFQPALEELRVTKIGAPMPYSSTQRKSNDLELTHPQTTRPLVSTIPRRRIIQDVRITERAHNDYTRNLVLLTFFFRATELTVQSERAFQKQPHIFLNSKTKAKSARPGKSGRRWYKDVGLGFRTPKTAIEGSYIDKKCPFTGLVSIRGRILTGTVVSTKMHRTLIIRREYLHFIPKYSRYEKRHKNLAAHVSPAFRVEEGDQVTVGQCRPLSKTVRFNVLRVLPRASKSVKKFSKF